MAKSPLNDNHLKKEEVKSRMQEGTSASVYERRKPGKKGRAVAVVENTEDDGSKTYEKVVSKVDKEGYVEGGAKRRNTKFWDSKIYNGSVGLNITLR
jgi:hypothetical protein